MSVSQGDGQIKCSRFSDEQIIGILKEQEAGAVAADVCRRHGISEAIFYKWKAKFGGLEVSEWTSPQFDQTHGSTVGFRAYARV